MTRLLPLLLLAACVRIDLGDQHRFPADAVFGMAAAVERGQVVVAGPADGAGEPDEVVLDVTSWGVGSSRKQAVRREAGNTLQVVAEGGAMQVVAASSRAGGGHDLRLTSTSDFALDVEVLYGGVLVEHTVGDFVLDAERVDLVDVAGNGRVTATASGADLDLRPEAVCRVDVDVVGTLTLRLPAYGPYDLQISTDADADVDVQDIGFDELSVESGVVRAWREPGTCVLRGTVRSGGRLEIVEGG